MSRTIRNLSILTLLVVLVLSIGACELGGETNAKPFVPLPPPTGASHILGIQQLSMGSSAAQIMSVTSPHTVIVYRENDGVSVLAAKNVGKTATEIMEVGGVTGTMTQFGWGGYENASLTIVEYFGPDMDVVRGMVVLEFSEASILQIFAGHGKFVVDRSSLQLIYEPPYPGGWPVLVEATYHENWGFKGDGILYGGTAVWSEGLENLLPGYTSWGFWETNATPGEQVYAALTGIVAHKLNGADPNFEAVDEDSVGRELIGRQTGLRLYRDGVETGKVHLYYANNWGRQPNTGLIGKGALSRVDWEMGEQYYALIVMSPDLSPVGSSLYLFVDSREAATNLIGKNPVKLYGELRENKVPGVFYAAWAEGDIGTVSASVQGGEGGSVDVGDQGGVQFRVLGDPEYEDVVLASNLMSMLGKAQKYVGLYYAYKPGSGSSLVYVTAAMRLILADPERVMREPGMDVGVLDTVTVPDLSAPPFTGR